PETLEAGEHPQRAVERPAARHRVDVGARHHDRGPLAEPAEDVAGRIPAGGAPGRPRDASGGIAPDGRERLDVLAQSAEIDAQLGRAHPSASPEAAAVADRGVPSGRKHVATSVSTVAPTPSQNAKPIASTSMGTRSGGKCRAPSSRPDSRTPSRAVSIAPMSATPSVAPTLRKKSRPDVATPRCAGSMAFCTATTSEIDTSPMPIPV